MKNHYKKIILSSTTAILLVACGGGSGKENPTQNPDQNISIIKPEIKTKLAKAQLGVLSGATVKIEELGAVPYKHLYTEKTSLGDSIESIGNFNAHSQEYDKDKFYLISVSGGLDMDANDDGKIDEIPTINKGTFHAIVKGEEAKVVEGAFKVTTASELVYKKVESDIKDTSTLEVKLDESAKEVFQKSTNDSAEISNADILNYDPVKHKEHFQEAYQDRLIELIKDIHDDKNVTLKLAPTAYAGIDKSIMIDSELELKGRGLDLDGKIVSYVWSEGSDILSEQKTFIYASNTTGPHTLTLTVTDNDDQKGSDRVNITVNEKPNSTPTAKSKTINVTEDIKQSFTLEGEDKDEDTLTYKILTKPVYGMISGEAPSLNYTPDANFNGDDRLIFVTNDGKADSKKALIKFHVKPSNDKPEIIFDDKITTKEDTPKRFSLKAEDEEKDKLSYEITEKPNNGTLTHKNDNFIYTPKADFYGEDNFMVTVKDGNGGEDSKKIDVDVTPVNDAPTVDIGDSKSVIAGESITLKAIAKDIDGKIVKYEWREGEKLLSTQSSFAYKQEGVGSHTVTLTITDNKGATAIDRVVIHVDDLLNTKPVSENITIDMKEDTSTNIRLKASDKDEDKLTYKIIKNPLHGTLSGKAPYISYSPIKDYFGKDSFSYRANDGKDDSNIATVNIDIKDVIEADKKAPVIDLHGKETMTVTMGKKIVIPAPTAKDDRDGNVKVTTTGKVDTSKVGTYKVTYTATDKAGNKATKTRTIKVIKALDTTPPKINLSGPIEQTLYLGDIYVEKGTNAYHSGVDEYWLANDDIDGYIKITIKDNIDTSKVGTYKITYTAVDKAGNKATKTRTIKVLKPTYAVIYTVDGNKLTVKWSGFPLSSHHIYINSPKGGGNYYLKGSKGEKTYVLYQGEHKINHYTLAIKNSKKEVVYKKEFDVKPLNKDTTPPKINLLGSTEQTLYIGETYVEKGTSSTTSGYWTAYDYVDGSIKITISGKVDTSKAGTYVVTYKATDKAGNKATKTRTIRVIRTKAPVITLEGSSTITLFQGEKYKYISRSAKDDRDGDVQVIKSGEVDTSKPGTYTLVYTAVDSEGNKATKTRTVKVLKSEYTVSYSFDEKNIIFDWNSFPRVFHTIEVSYTTKYSNGTSKLRKSPTYTYSKRKGSGSVHLYTHNVDATITIYDNHKKVISTQHIKIPSEESLSPIPKLIFDSKYVKGDTIKVKVGDTIHLPMPKAYSIKYKSIPVKIVKITDVYSDKNWPVKNTFVVTSDMSDKHILVRYEAKDPDGNVGKGYVSYYVNKLDTPDPVRPDTKAPSITIKGNFRWKDSGGTLRDYYPRQQLSGTYKEAGATAVDARDGKVSVKISYGKLTGSLFRTGKPSSKQGIYVVFYTAKDKAGNKEVDFKLVLRNLAAWYPGIGYEDNVRKYINEHFDEF